MMLTQAGKAIQRMNTTCYATKWNNGASARAFFLLVFQSHNTPEKNWDLM